jgi:hypothetical protein
MVSMLARFESSGLLHVETPKNPCECNSCLQQRGTSLSHCGCLSDYPHAEGCIKYDGGNFEHFY